jgi:hypothetical protein
MSVTTRRFRSLLARSFAPQLRDAGFRGTGGVYRGLESAPFVHLVQLFVDRHGASAWLELGVHVDGLPAVTQTVVNDREIDVAGCLIRRDVERRALLWRKRVVVPLGASDDEALGSIAVLTSAVATQAPRFFAHWSSFPEPLVGLSVDDVLRGRLDKNVFGDPLPLPLLLLLAELHVTLDHPRRAQEFAEAGLGQIDSPRGVHLERLFQRILDGERRFGFTPADLAEFTKEQDRFFDEL